MFDFEYIKDIVKKNALAIGAIAFGLLCLLGAGGVVYYYTSLKEDSTQAKEVVDPLELEETSTEVANETLKVDVKGAVKKAGVYELQDGSNIQDAIGMAGGVTSKGSTENINLAKKLTDEMVIYVFTKDELKKKETTNEIVYEIPECKCETVTVTECPSVNTPATTDKTDDKTDDKTNTGTNNTSKKVSINTATLQELTTLDGIGESKAQAIIDYRNTNGPFKTIEDLMNVSGIGESAFSKLKDYITI